MSRLVALVNPAAGAGRAQRIFDELCRAEPRLAAADVVRAADAEGSRRGLAAHIAAGAERVLVLGGDGSIQLAANVLLEQGAGERVALGLVPAGTGSDLARNLGVPRDPRAALARALSSPPRAIDAIAVTTDDGRHRVSVNVASAGISGMVDEIVAAMPTKGHTGYLRATLAVVARYKTVPCRVEVDGEPWYEDPLMLLAVANSATFGNGMRVAPGARLDDGLAEVILIGDIPRWQIPLRLPQIYLGTHLRSRHSRFRQARSVRLEPLAPLPPLDLDGEAFASAPTRFELLPAALRVLA